MHAKLVLFFAAAVTAIAADAAGQDLQSGLPVGKTMLSMPIEKIAGVDDGVSPGQTICYT